MTPNLLTDIVGLQTNSKYSSIDGATSIQQNNITHKVIYSVTQKRNQRNSNNKQHNSSKTSPKGLT